LDLKLYQSGIGLTGTVALAQFEREQGKVKLQFILDTIEGVGSKAEAARRLGVSPTHLQYLLGQSKAAKAKGKTDASARRSLTRVVPSAERA
jgi:hypothetical protein